MNPSKKTASLTGAKILNAALMVSFIITVLVPLTGVRIHKLASLLFLLLSLIHTIVYRKRLGAKRFWLLAVVVISFATGLAGMMLYQYPIIMKLHRAVSIAAVFFLAIHIFVYRKKLSKLLPGASA